MEFSREFIFRRERNSRADSKGRGEVCPGYFTSAFRDLPMVCLDQLDNILALGAALFSPPQSINQHHGQLLDRILHILAKYPFGV